MQKYIIIAEDGNGAVRCENVKAPSRYRACRYAMDSIFERDWTITHIFEHTGEWDGRA